MVTPVRVREILRAAARAWGIEPAARLAIARGAWPSIVGPVLARSSAPVALRGACLLVGVTHPAVGQEIRLRGAEIVKALVRELREDVVTGVVPVARRHLTAAAPRRQGSRTSRRTPERPPRGQGAGSPRVRR